MDFFRLNLTFPCACGTLEGCLLYHDSGYRGPGVIICPPHPLLAGNMENNVITALAETIAPSMPVLLFNYRGVGKSCSPQPQLPLYEYWQQLDTKDRYQEVIDDVIQIVKSSASYFRKHHLIGYSFGSYIALEAANKKTLSYTAITPPLLEHDFGSLSKLNIPQLIVVAEDDDLLEAPDFNLLKPAVKQETIKGTNHFFRKRESEVAAVVSRFLQLQG